MGIQQVGRTVQRDGGLTGAGTTLHDEGAPELGPDDGILLGLDRCNDVAHSAGTGRTQGRE